MKFKINPYTPKREIKIKNQIEYLQNKKQEHIKIFELILAFIILFSGFIIGYVSDGSGLSTENYILKFNNSHLNYSENNFSIIIPELESGSIKSEKTPNYQKIFDYLLDSISFMIILAIFFFGMIITSLKIYRYDIEINRLYLKLSGTKEVSYT